MRMVLIDMNISHKIRKVINENPNLPIKIMPTMDDDDIKHYEPSDVMIKDIAYYDDKYYDKGQVEYDVFYSKKGSGLKDIEIDKQVEDIINSLKWEKTIVIMF